MPRSLSWNSLAKFPKPQVASESAHTPFVYSIAVAQTRKSGRCTSSELREYVDRTFGVTESEFQSALEMSPGAQGSIAGAISEILLKRRLEDDGFEVLRIKEKPSGGNDEKNSEARGDFYFRPQGSKKNEWWVIESKGLKSNSEFRGGKLDSPDKVFNFLNSRIFNPRRSLDSIYESGRKRYEKERKEWESKRPSKPFPKFRWSRKFPGAESFNLNKIWNDSKELESWANSLPTDRFSEAAYRSRSGAVVILETHQPSQRKAPITGKVQTAPLVGDFNVMAVDLFFRTGSHKFVFMNSREIAHSPTSPEHLYQNYTIDILIPGIKDQPSISRPWYPDIKSLIKSTSPPPQPLDKSQLDRRGEE